jgi:hypothetical protein
MGRLTHTYQKPARESAAPRRGQDLLEPRTVPLADDPSFQELPHGGRQPLVHDQLGHDQERQGEEESDLHLDVLEEGHLDAAQGLSLKRRENQERRPCHDGQEDHPSLQPVEGWPKDARAQEELVERPSEHEREVSRLRVILAFAHRAGTRLNTSTWLPAAFRSCSLHQLDLAGLPRLVEECLFHSGFVLLSIVAQKASWIPK